MGIERVAPESIRVTDPDPALKVTQSGSGHAFVVEDSESPDTSAFIIDNQGRVGVKKTPTRDLDVDGLVSGTNVISGYATTATAGGSTTLTATSARQQFFTGTQSQTIVLPVANTLSVGQSFEIHNNSTGALTINSSGGNLVKALASGHFAIVTCILASGTTAASWDVNAVEPSNYATTTTAAGTTTLTVTSAQRQFFTGTQGQTIVLPVASTLTLGQFFTVYNNSSGALTVNSSGGNLVRVLGPNSTATFTCILTSGTTAASWDVDFVEGSAYATTATAGSTTVLSVSSAQRQFFTGTTTQTVTLPVASTISVGQEYIIHNNSTGVVTVQSSGANTVYAIPAGSTVVFTCILNSGTDASSWDYDITGNSGVTGTGTLVLSASPTLTGTPAAPTAAVGNSTTQIATTAFVNAEISNDAVLQSGGSMTGELSITANTSGNALRVTQTGAGDVIRVEDEANPDSTPFIVKSDGLVGIGTATPTEKLSVVGDISATGDLIADGIESSLAQAVLSESVFYIDATNPGASTATVKNLGTGGSILNARLGSTSTADSNDPKWLEYFEGDGAYVYLPGVTSNFLSSADDDSLDITGDIDIRAKVALDDWTPSAEQIIVRKWWTTNSYFLSVLTSGLLRFAWTTDGTTFLSADSTVATGISDGSIRWVRATLDVDNGASGRTITFYTSTDGSTWTQLGSPVVQAGTTSIHAGTGALYLGDSYGTGVKFYRVEILAGIDGYRVYNFDPSGTTSSATQSFSYAAPRVNLIPNPSFENSDLTSFSSANTTTRVSDQKLFGNFSARTTITSTTDANIAAWGAGSTLISEAAPYIASAYFFIPTGSTLAGRTVTLSFEGGSTAAYTVGASTPATLVAGSWVRASRAVSFSSAPTTSPAVVARISGDLPSASGLQVFTDAWLYEKAAVLNPYFDGSYPGSAWLGTPGRSSSVTVGTSNRGTSISRTTSGRKTTVVCGGPGEGSKWLFGTDDYMEVANRWIAGTVKNVYLPGVAGNYMSTPDAAALDITGDIDLRAYVSMDDWTPSSAQYLIAKYGNASNHSYILLIGTDGTVGIQWFADGSTVLGMGSTLATGLTNGSVKWVRATLDVDNGASGRTAQFFLSDDGITWTQLGTSVTQATATNIFSGTSPVNIGALTNSVGSMAGRVLRAQIYNGINGTLVLDVNPQVLTSVSQTTFTEQSSNAATVTINKSGTGYVSTPILQSGYIQPTGVSNLTAATSSLLDFEASDSLTVLVVSRTWSTPTNYMRYLEKGANTGNGYSIQSNATSLGYFVGVIQNSTWTFRDGLAYTGGTLQPVSLTLNRATNTLTATRDTGSSSTSSASVGSISNPTSSLRIGAQSPGTAGYGEFEFVSAVIWRRALSSTEIAAVNNYFLTRTALGETLTVKTPRLLVAPGGRFVGSGAIYAVTSSTRPTNPVEGDVIYEQDTKLFFGWDGSLWKSIGGGAKGGGNDDVFYENSKSVTVNYAITTGKNAMTAGPVDIQSGVTVEIPSGSVWTIV